MVSTGVPKNASMPDAPASISTDGLRDLILEAQKEGRSTRVGQPLGADSGILYHFRMDSVAKGCLPQKGEGYAALRNSDGTERKLWSITYFAALTGEAEKADLEVSEMDGLLMAFSAALRTHLVPRFDGIGAETYDLNESYGCINSYDPEDSFRHFSGELKVSHYGRGTMVSVKYVGGTLS